MKLVNEMSIPEFDWAIRLNRITFDLIGVWPSTIQHNQGKFRQLLQVPFEILLMLMCAAYPQFYALMLSGNDLDLITQNLLSSIECCVFTLKVIILWFNKEAMLPILCALELDWRDIRKTWERDIMMRVAKRGRVLTILGLTLSVGGLLLFVGAPAIGRNLRIDVVNVTNLNGRDLPFPSHYAYDFSESPYYEICYISQVACCTIVFVCFTSPVSLFGVLVFHICGQIEILSVKMRKLRMLSASKHDVLLYNRIWSMKLASIVNVHANIIRTTRRVESYFTLFILMQMLSVPVIIGVMGFRFLSVFDQESMAMPIVQLFFFAFTVFMLLAHVFVYCLIGENLVFYSEGLLNSIYESSWYSYCGKSTLSLIPIMIRTKNALRLTAGKCLYLNLETFCNLLKTIAGYLSMLVAVSNKVNINV